MDAGWIQTYDYYYKQEVSVILQEVIEVLKFDYGRKFTYSIGDIGFFRDYYEQQTAEYKNLIKDLIKSGQMEVLHGGMVSTDEACTDYGDIIRNFEQGH